MKPILYDGDEIAFASNGLGRIGDAVRCEVTEERNGMYICELDVPVTSPMYSLIREGRYIGSIHDDRHDVQPFEIYGRSAPIDGVVTFYAHHLSYKLRGVILKPFTAQSCAETLQKMQTETYNPNPFTFWTDKNVSAAFKNDVPSACRSMLAGQQGSVLDVYGTGEYEYDKWAVKLHLHRGGDNGVAIRHGVNLTDLQQDTDASSSYSAAAPYWRNDDGATVVTLPEGYVVSPNAPTCQYPWTTDSGEYVTTQGGEVIMFNVPVIVIAPLDLSRKFENAPTEAQLRQAALDHLESNQPWKLKDNLTISFVDLAHTEEYKDIAALQRVSLCDRVSVYCGPLGVNAVSMQVIRTVYDALSEAYVEMELGSSRATYADAIMSEVEKKTDTFVTGQTMEKAVQHATRLITGGLGGYVVLKPNADGQPEELLIMDTPDPLTAVNVWRFNRNGLAHSHNGYNGPFDDIAMTADGKINAGMITTGKIMDASGENYWLLSGAGSEFVTRKGVIGDFTLENGSLLYGSQAVGGTGAYIGKDGISYNTTLTDDPDTPQNLVKTEVFAQGIKMYWNNILRTIVEVCRSTGTGGFHVGTYDTQGNLHWPFQIWDDVTRVIYLRFFARCLEDFYVNGNVVFLQNLRVDGNLTVKGTKNRVVGTEQYSDRLLYAYETPAPMFGDVGEGVIAEDGRCHVWIDPIFAQTIADGQYQVFLQKYGSGDCWVAERGAGRFVVEGTPGLAFGWEIKARQRDYDQRRLDVPIEEPEKDRNDYADMAAQYIERLHKGRMEA